MGIRVPSSLQNKDLKHTICACMLTIHREKVHRINVQFQAQKTYWEYLLISKNNIAITQYKIEDETGNYTFKNQGIVSVLGTQAISYISEQKIPYNKQPITKIKLVANEEELVKYQTIEDQILPHANPENIQKYGEEEPLAFKTQTIIYI